MQYSKIGKYIGLPLFCYLALLSLSYSNIAAYQPIVTLLAGVLIYLGIRLIGFLYDRYGGLPVFWGILLMGAALRILWAVLAPTEQVSDFYYFNKAALDLSQGNGVLTKNMGFTLLISMGYRLYPHVLTGKLINAFAGIVALIFLYLAGSRLINQKAALIAIFVLALLPNEIMMGSVLGTEVIVTALGVIVFYFLVQLSGDQPTQSIKPVLAAGLFYGLAFTVRSSYIFYFPAILLWIILVTFRDLRKMGRFLGSFFAGLLIGLILMLVGYSLSTGRFSLLPLQTQESFPVLSGTNIDFSGQWNKKDSDLYFSWPYETRNALARHEALHRIKSNPGGFLLLIPKKIYMLVAANDYPVFWSLQNIDWGSRTGLIKMFSQSIYIIILLSCLYAYLKSDNYLLLNILLVLTLSLLIPHFLLEVQGRYHHYIMPFWILLSAEGLQRITKTRSV
jgi:hypothetical protein